MKRIIISTLMTIALVVPMGGFVYSSSSDEDSYSDVRNYCKEYGLTMSYSSEFVKEVRSQISSKEFGVQARSSSSGIFMKKRYIPTAAVADIIWTNNPTQPFNHVGIYIDTNKTSEALKVGKFKGEITIRNAGRHRNEYPFEIYKVVTTNNGNTRYALNVRKKVANWAAKQNKKPYDFNFANNKTNNPASNAKFNCSEYVWKAWKFNAGVDLDSNGGKGVYPNDIKKSKRVKCIYVGR